VKTTLRVKYGHECVEPPVEYTPDAAKIVPRTGAVLWTYRARLEPTWNIAHGPSGKAVVCDFATRTAAVAFAQKPWSMLTPANRRAWAHSMNHDEARQNTPALVQRMVRSQSLSNATALEQKHEAAT
jgi:uncharacterized protein YbdZ (MbtH family)